MLRYKWPKKTHLVYFIPGLLLWVAQEGLAAMPWWQGLPFGWIWAVIGAYGVGVWADDLNNSQSWVRHNWREWRRVFDVIACHADHRRDGQERIDIRCLLKFRRDVENKRLTVRVITATPREPITHVTHDEPVTFASRDSKKELRLGSIAITRPGAPFARHSVWGSEVGAKDIAPGQATIPHQSKNIVEIAVGAQTYRVYAHILDPAREDSARIYLLTEDDAPTLLGRPDPLAS